MHPFWEKVEEVNSRIIPSALVVLLVIIIFEIFLHTENEKIALTVEIIDALIITIFAIDLTFLAIHAHSTKFFFKNYWLDILAILPLGIFFKVASRAYETAILGERLTVGQAVFHESLEARKGFVELLKSGKAAKFARIAARLTRILSKSQTLRNVFHKYLTSKQNHKRGINTRKKRSWQAISHN